MKKISVIVPVYNVEKYLKRCLDSLVNQTYKNIEIIVVNDGSSDNSQSIIDKYVKKYPKLIFAFEKENGGLSDARNFGIKKAKGDYLSFVDSDDYLDLTTFEKVSNKINEGFEIVVINSQYLYDNNKTKELNKIADLENDYHQYVIAPPMAPTRIIKKEILNKNNRFKKGIFYEDLELIPTLILSTKKIGVIDKPLYYYYQRSGSIMKQKEFNNKLLDIFLVLESIKKKFKDSNQLKDYQNEIEFLYIEHLLYSASLRFSGYKNGRDSFKRCQSIIKKEYPNWQNNKYLKQKSKIFNLVCKLSYNNNYLFVKILNKIKK